MIVSKRRHLRRLYLAMLIVGALLLVSAFAFNKYSLHISIIDDICVYGIVGEAVIITSELLIKIFVHKGLKKYISDRLLLLSIEDNLLSIGAYIRKVDNAFAELPSIRIRNNTIKIKLDNLRVRTIIERYLNSFSTALPDRYVVEDYYITPNNNEVVITYEDIKTYKAECYSISEYIKMIRSLKPIELYFDRKHVVSINDYPHYLVSGASGSGKSYLANEIVIQAIVKEWDIVICDIKRSYGLYRAYSDYVYEIDDIIDRLHSVESEMNLRMEKLQPILDKNPQALAIDIGYKPMLVVIEEYISLLSSVDKKQKEELERVVKNISVLARQSNIHLMIVMQSAGTENINATTRSNLTKVLLGNAQSNILTATFGTGIDVPHIKLNKGQGLIQLDRITMLRVPMITNVDDFNAEFSEMPKADLGKDGN